MSSGEVFFVSGEPLWPSNHGGRVRAARLAREIDRQLPARVVAPLEAAPEDGLQVEELPPALPTGRLSAALSPAPRLGQLLLDARRRDVLGRLIDTRRPRAVVFAQSYLAAVMPQLAVPAVVDFTDLEIRRMASFARFGRARARAAFWMESRKARRWEPGIARRATLCTTPSQADAEVLRSWEANAVLVPHGADVTERTSSPAEGPVTFVASFSYEPNRRAAAFLTEEVWPRLQREQPGLRLRLVGRPAERLLPRHGRPPGVEVVGDPEDVGPYYRGASLIVAPVQAGGGSQVKMTEALAHGRVVVATPFSAASAPQAARIGLVVCEGAEPFASAVCRLWCDLEERRRREDRLLRQRLVPTWEETCAPLVEMLVGAGIRR